MVRCAISKCKRPAIYFMGFPDPHSEGDKQYGFVCDSHDKRIGRRNLVLAGMTREQAIKFEEE